jgi:hypothetical protein
MVRKCRIYVEASLTCKAADNHQERVQEHLRKHRPWISPTDPRPEYQKTQGQKTEGTCQLLLENSAHQEFIDSSEERHLLVERKPGSQPFQSSPISCMQCTDPAGAGESVLSPTVLSSVLSANGTGYQVLDSFFPDGNQKKSTASEMAASFVDLLVNSTIDQECMLKILKNAHKTGNGADLLTADSKGDTMLHWATRDGHEALAQLLIENGADVSVTDSDGLMPLHQAANYGDEAVAQLLIDKGSDASAGDNHGRMPLHTAAEYGSVAGHED